jgi:hypothetical protein
MAMSQAWRHVDVGLLPVENPMVAVAPHGGREGHGVGAGLLLGHSVRADDLAPDHGRYPTPFLFFTAEGEDRTHDRPELAVDPQRQPVVAAAVADRPEDDDSRFQVGAGTAVPGRHDQAEQSELRRCPPQRAPVRRIDGATRIAAFEIPGQSVGGEGPGRGAPRKLVGGQWEVHDGFPCC